MLRVLVPADAGSVVVASAMRPTASALLQRAESLDRLGDRIDLVEHLEPHDLPLA